MNRAVLLLTLTASAFACDDSEGSSAALADGFYTLVRHSFGPCGAPVEVTDCPECQIDNNLIEVKTESFAGQSGVFYSACETDTDCFFFAATPAGVSELANAGQTYASSGGVCDYRTIDFAIREAEGGTELVLITFGGEMTEAECDRYFESDDVPPRDSLTCLTEEVALVVPR